MVKKLILAASLLVGCSISYQKADAQISLIVNIGSQPDWGP